MNKKKSGPTRPGPAGPGPARPDWPQPICRKYIEFKFKVEMLNHFKFSLFLLFEHFVPRRSYNIVFIRKRVYITGGAAPRP